MKCAARSALSCSWPANMVVISKQKTSAVTITPPATPILSMRAHAAASAISVSRQPGKAACLSWRRAHHTYAPRRRMLRYRHAVVAIGAPTKPTVESSQTSRPMLNTFMLMLTYRKGIMILWLWRNLTSTSKQMDAGMPISRMRTYEAAIAATPASWSITARRIHSEPSPRTTIIGTEASERIRRPRCAQSTVSTCAPAPWLCEHMVSTALPMPSRK